MQTSRVHGRQWWTIAILATAIVQCGILLVDEREDWQLVVGLAATAVFLASWFAFGLRSEERSPPAIAFVGLTVLYAGAVTIANPSLAIVQCIAFPIAWTFLAVLRSALMANLAIAVSVGIGLYVSIGGGPDALGQALAIEAVSLAFSLAIGFWILSIEGRSTERQRLLDELQATQAELALANRAAGVVSERSRLAREIHDTIAQDLTGIVLIAQRASRDLAADSVSAAQSQLDLLEESARSALAETRALVASSAPPGLEAGVGPAIERLALRFERETGIAVNLDVDATASVDRDTEVVLLRCAQEAFANIRKHSGASTASVRLAGRQLEVSDNGCGFDAEAGTSGFGLTGMRERLALVGGSLDIASGGAGTTVRVLA